MKQNLFIFIGGSDEQNGDYSRVHRLAERGGTIKWSSVKGARPGDRALIYIQSPHSALLTKAEVLAESVKGRPGDYAYRAKTGNFKLLPNQVGIEALNREFPRWGWPRYPRSKALVPARYAERLWKMVHQKVSTVQVLISNATRGIQSLEKLAASGRTKFWPAPKLTTVGDTVLFYVEGPVSAIVAVGKALSGTRPTEDWWYEAKVGKVRLLDAPIHLEELRAMFPHWLWVKNMSMFAYVSPERAKALVQRCALKAPAGAGYGDAETNRLVEVAAIKRVTQHLKRLGYTVVSREKDGKGYDLDARKGRAELHVEVKGVSGELIQFPITRGEVAQAERDPSFHLMVVTRARTPQAKLHKFRGRDLKRKFSLTALSYLAAKSGQRTAG